MSNALTALVVEDDRIQAQSWENMLVGRGVTVHHAFSLHEAEKQIVDHPELNGIVLDLGLPDSQGISTLTILRANTQLPIVVLTVDSSEQVALESVRKGAESFLLKQNLSPASLFISLLLAVERKRTYDLELTMTNLMLELKMVKNDMSDLRKVVVSCTETVQEFNEKELKGNGGKDFSDS